MAASPLLFASALALASAMTVSSASAATVTLNPTIDGQITENGDGTTGQEVLVGGAELFTRQSTFLSSTIAFEFDLSSIVASAVTGVQLILTQFGDSGVLVGDTALQVQGYAGDGQITFQDINPIFSFAGTIGDTLGTITLNDGVNYPFGAQYVFDIDPAALFGLVGPGDLLSLRVNALDADTVTQFGFFGISSTGIDYDLIAPGTQGGTPAQLVFTTQQPSAVPLPASLPLLVAGLWALAFARRRARKAA